MAGKPKRFTDEEVAEIRAFYADHKWYGFAGVGRKYGCNSWTISKIVRRADEYS